MLGAFYAWDSAHEPVQAITPAPGAGVSGLGAYYAWDSAHEPVQPINGLGGTAEDRLSDEAARALIGKRRAVGTFSEWARQVTDHRWNELDGQSVLTLIPITTGDLKSIHRCAYGLQVATIGILWPGPVQLIDQQRVLEGTAYLPSMSLALYDLGDRRQVARPVFLTLASLRGPDDQEGGNMDVARAAAKLGGRLVYVVSQKRPRNARFPNAAFNEVFLKLGQMGADAHAAPAPSAAPSYPLWKVSTMLGMGVAASLLIGYGMGMFEKGK